MTDAAAEPLRRVKVVLPLPMGNGYDYKVPLGMAAEPGDFVVVPLGPRMVRGVVWTGEADATVADEKLKPLAERIDARPLPADVMAFVDWVANYTLSPKGTVLRLVMRSGQVFEPIKGQTGFLQVIPPPADLRLTEKRQAVYDAAHPEIPQTASMLAKAAGVSDAVVRGLAKAGGLAAVDIDPDPPFAAPDPGRPGRELSDDQKAAADDLIERVKAGRYSSTLIDGVTGSGKTEVYLEAAAAALAASPTAQVCVLLPEIALTLPFLQRIEDRFGTPAAHWHSDLSSAERRRVWKRVADGNARLVVGARSALFLPYADLRLIVVDEEHEAAYKQHDGVLYQARDMAVARGALGGFPVVLVSATPSLETLANVEEGRYDIIQLTSRFGPAQMPETAIVDLRSHPPEKGEWLSPKVVDAINDTLSRQEQVLLYLNRRGYAPVTLCRKCGEKMTAPDSDTWLVEHKYTGRLVCHHTGFSMPRPDHCPHCGAFDSLVPCGPGVERIEEEARLKWPDRVVEVLSSDTMMRPGATKSLLERMTNGEIDILVATQAAAKGHNFPNLTLVAAVDADLGLAGGDLRAAERTFQTLSQVAGRAGRAEKPGRVMLQSYQPDSPVIRALEAQDRDGFASAELEGRASLGFPPYGRLAAIILSGENEAALNEAARQLAQVVPQAEGVEIWGPAPAPLYRLRGTYRLRFLVKTDRRVSIQNVVATWLSRTKLKSSVRMTVDVDPYIFT
ncbi:primosomal protein N' [Parvularcula sp. LCG005]|nr:primosomal protein N' [Parvularcula sp. LCG005]WOI53409.1 primosomal protein N' [Parvularcula sp. LCG005]